ncbi:hypothetical protein QX776_06135 [Alteromonadaceae bacterium BrNp21-10]|nr:hypothetical protein [Alteromonadaceae bacterium BrNp21-10]
MRTLGLKFLISMTSVAALTLSGCGGSSSDDDTSSFEYSYIQFYNGVANSKSTLATLTDNDDADSSIGSASYADVTSMVTVTPDTEYLLNLSYADEDGQQIDFAEQDIKLVTSHRQLVMFVGDYENPQLITIDHLREDLDNEFRLFFVNTTSKVVPLEILVAEVGDGIEDAVTVGNISFGNVIESDVFDLAEYHIFIVNADTGEQIFDSEGINFIYSTEYVVVLKDTFGPSQSQIALDVITSSTSVYEYDDLSALAEFRLYNAEKDVGDLNVSISGNTPVTLNEIEPLSMTDFNTVEFGDYQFSIQTDSLSAKNMLLTLNQNESKTMIVYRDQALGMRAVNFAQNRVSSSYQHVLKIVNLIDDFDDVQVYFVKEDETIDTADEYITGLSFADVNSKVLTSNSYNILLVHEDDNTNQVTLLARMDNVTLGATSELILIADEGDESAGDYELTLIE